LATQSKAKAGSSSTRVLAEALVMIALSAGLYMFKIFTFPEGGSVTLGSMIPIFILAFRRGARVGVVAGACLGLMVVVIEPFVYNPIQFVLDYPLAFAVLGVAGFFNRWPVVGVGVGIGARFICHFLSGSLYFCSYMTAGFSSCPVYSAFYNASYLIPEFLISAVIIFILAKRNILTVGG
jgi:thiamine transporter